MNLYQLTADWRAIDAALAEAEEAETPDNELATLLADMLEAAEGSIEQKGEQIAALVKECEALAAAAATESNRLRDLATKRRARAERYKAVLLEAMDAVGLKRIEGGACVVTARANGGPVPLVIEPGTTAEQAEATSPALVRVRKELDKEAVRDALERGATLPWARFGERGRHVVIK